jgi:hypothetical protein
MFKGILEENFHQHTVAYQEDKVAITWRVVDQVVVQQKGRFLVWDKQGGWKHLQDRNQMRSKVAVSFKLFKKQLKAHQNCQVNESSTYKFERQDGRKRKRDEDSLSSGCGCTL